MSFNIKTWVDRISEYPNRRRLTKEDNTQEVVTVERYEGDIATTGDKFNADTMNDLEERIDNAIRGIDSSAIKNITRSGTTFTATRLDNTTFTFTQQDTVYTLPTANGSTLGGIKVGSNLNINNGRFICTIIRKACNKWNYSNMGNKDTLADTIIKLPTKNDKPD